MQAACRACSQVLEMSSTESGGPLQAQLTRKSSSSHRHSRRYRLHAENGCAAIQTFITSSLEQSSPDLFARESFNGLSSHVTLSRAQQMPEALDRIFTSVGR